MQDTDTVARLGGDEFVVLLESIIDAEDAQRVVAKIRDAFEAPLPIAGHSLEIGMSIGIALYPEGRRSGARSCSSRPMSACT